MIITTSNSGHTAYGLKDYVIDKKIDLQNLPVDVPMVIILLSFGHQKRKHKVSIF